MESEPRPVSKSNWQPYVVPMALFLIITFAEGYFPAQYVLVYFAKMAIVTGALIWARPTWRDYRWEVEKMPKAIFLGLVLFVVWVVVERFVPYPHLGDRTAFDPFKKIENPDLRVAFFAVRFYGLVYLVPFMEELFWRSFGLRFGSRSDFESLPVGTFTEAGAVIACVFFALSHPEWLVGLIFAIAVTVLLGRTRSLFACFVCHAVTNLALGIYILSTGAWKLW